MLPFEGTLAKQPYKIIEIFNIIESRITEAQKAKEKGKNG
jgi:hypothetical protein